MTSEKEILKKLQEREKEAERIANEAIRKAEELGIIEKMDRNDFQYEVLQRKLLMALVGRPLNYTELDLAIKSGVVEQHNIPKSLDYSVKGINLKRYVKHS